MAPSALSQVMMGHVVPNPRVVLIYWDQYFHDTPAAVTSLGQFLSDLVTGSYWDGLSQYGVGASSFQGNVVIDMTKYPTLNSTKPGQSFSESQMQAQLVAWLDNGVVTPKPPATKRISFTSSWRRPIRHFR
jgi:hypothetical protein